jgi:hypothetical protein
LGIEFDRLIDDNRNPLRRRRRQARLGTAAVDTATFLGKLWRRDSGVEMEREKEHREKQEKPDQASSFEGSQRW